MPEATMSDLMAILGTFAPLVLVLVSFSIALGLVDHIIMWVGRPVPGADEVDGEV